MFPHDCPHLAQVGLSAFLRGLQDQGRMGLRSMRVAVSADWLGCDLTFRPEVGVPADRARIAYGESLRELSARGSRLNGDDHPLAKRLRRRCNHGAYP